ncbi:hypothetical protein RQM47_03015 [Rubrivirga sp. S365]|uniref:Uncharacterized protein n=1 Tax=Rubrivirga litoralis TaxID=3075598 RepID=A0ABU3BQW4_9BACT|nr:MULTISPECIES: hypothetical protein [unclassified Rubrivirga]MDT0631655.1 hypothetical protein [Rubrivirga sp. F394]MDT7855602.1 hypothetical protein [Rubrivirga sp. S365]
MPQKALVVIAGPTGAPTASLDRLDEHLRAGWRVAQATPMGGGGATDGFASLVVLERATETEAEALIEQIEEELDETAGDGGLDVQDPLLRRIVEEDE